MTTFRVFYCHLISAFWMASIYNIATSGSPIIMDNISILTYSMTNLTFLYCVPNVFYTSYLVISWLMALMGAIYFTYFKTIFPERYIKSKLMSVQIRYSSFNLFYYHMKNWWLLMDFHQFFHLTTLIICCWRYHFLSTARSLSEALFGWKQDGISKPVLQIPIFFYSNLHLQLQSMTALTIIL